MKEKMKAAVRWFGQNILDLLVLCVLLSIFLIIWSGKKLCEFAEWYGEWRHKNPDWIFEVLAVIELCVIFLLAAGFYSLWVIAEFCRRWLQPVPAR